MAMMTGRVLLVCALCVLWWGAVFGRAEPTPASPASPPSKDNSPKNDNNSTGVAAGVDPNGQQKAPQEKSPASESPESPAEATPAPQGGSQQTVKSSQVYLLVRQEHRI
ncbi:mucin-associated surface protein (MASP) [Trypanosoma cruzi]|nr:mucin-associated surface protein (MASP) [Trypanosoma cruzi]